MGWTRGKIGILITTFPGRKKKKLCVKIGNQIQYIGTFADDGSAELFDKVLDYLIEGKKWESTFW